LWLLNTLNGTVNCNNGKLQPHNPQDYITKNAAVEYPVDAGADCPMWEATLSDIWRDDRELIESEQRFLGYCLTGDVREQVLKIWHGLGANGKSTVLNAMLDILGDYGMRAPSELLMARRDDKHPTMFADLAGKRLVVCVETGDGRHLAESVAKELTSSEPLPARRMRENYWRFTPTHKLVLATNHKPTIRGTDHGIWRRMALVPFEQCYWDADKGETGPEDLKADKTLPERLRNEYPAILRWLVAGCLAWQRDGLRMPERVRTATDAYRQQMDVVGQFLREECEQHHLYAVSAGALYQRYKEWGGLLSQRRFGDSLSERGFKSDRFSSGA
jgi:putative DNA primase/helicase